jgi:hypothetical protein
MELHPYLRQDLVQETGMRNILDVSIEEVADYLYEKSPFKDSNYARLENDFRTFLRNLNFNMLAGMGPNELRAEYVLGVVGISL